MKRCKIIAGGINPFQDLQQYVNWELPDIQSGFRKGRGTRDQIANIHWIIEKARKFQKTTASLTTLKPLTVWITANCGKFLIVAPCCLFGSSIFFWLLSYLSSFSCLFVFSGRIGPSKTAFCYHKGKSFSRGLFASLPSLVFLPSLSLHLAVIISCQDSCSSLLHLVSQLPFS